MLSAFFEVEQNLLAAQAVGDPRAAVALDVAALHAETRVAGVRVSGLIYDVATGLIDTVVKPTSWSSGVSIRAWTQPTCWGSSKVRPP